MGGASSPTTPRELLACPDIDGALVGGASLKAGDFLAIIQAGQEVTARGKPDLISSFGPFSSPGSRVGGLIACPDDRSSWTQSKDSTVGILTAIFNTLIVLISLFLICLILIQRGKGGGLAGAFGGVGGSSAFGTKAGDVFTRVTVVTAVDLDPPGHAPGRPHQPAGRPPAGGPTRRPRSSKELARRPQGQGEDAGPAPAPSALAPAGSSAPAEAPAPSGASRHAQRRDVPRRPRHGTPRRACEPASRAVPADHASRHGVTTDVDAARRLAVRSSTHSPRSRSPCCSA